MRGETKFPRYDTLQALEKVLFADCSSEWKENGSAGNHANDLIQETLEYLTKTTRGIFGAPDFCIEVGSDSSRKRDYGIKVQKYMNAGVREYWIIDAKRQKIICYWFEGKKCSGNCCVYVFGSGACGHL